jgi:hypothetical protein
MADVLNKKLGGLDEKTRDYALGQIFGNQQVTAATVLIQGQARASEKGAQSVQEWTKAVNDQGFAAEQAGGKLDSLQGDVAKLRASFQNGLIESGSAANGVLRGIVQTATGAVDIFDNMPKPLQEAALGIAGVTATVGLLGGATVLSIPKIAEFNATLGTLSEGSGSIARASGALRTGLGATASFLTGPWGLAIGGAATLVGGIFVKSQLEAKQRVDDLRGSLDQETAAITKSTRAMVAKSLEDDGAFSTAKKLGLQLDVVTDAALGNKDAIDQVRKAVDAYSKAHESLGSRQKNPLELEAQTFAQSVLGEADSLKKAKEAQKDLIAAQKSGSDASSGAASAAGGAASSIDGLSGSADDATDSLDDLANALAGLGGTQRDVESATIQYRDAIDSVTQSVKDNGTGLDDNTEAGRKNNQSLLDLASSVTDLAAKQAAAGASADDLTGTMQVGRDAFISAAEAAGATADQASALADKYGLIPADVKTTITALGTTAAISGAAAVKSALDQLPDVKTVRIQLSGDQGLKVSASTIARASGGVLPGAPSKRDNMLIAAASGEFVVNSEQTTKHRALLEAINNGTLPGYSSGGMIRMGATARGSYESALHYAAPIVNANPTVNVAPAVVNMEGMRAVFSIGGRQIEAVIESVSQAVVNSAAASDARTGRNGKRRY